MNCPQHLVLDEDYDSSTLIFACHRPEGHLDAHFDGHHMYWTDRT